MNPNALDAALSMIDLAKWKPCKVQIVLNVKLNTLSARLDGAQLGYRGVAQDTGIEARWVHKMLAELVEERVLNVALESSGRRPTIYSIEPDLRRWSVPWQVSIIEVLSLAEHVSGGGVSTNPGFVPRYGAAQTNVVTRWGAAQRPPSAAPERGTTRFTAPRQGAAQTHDARDSHPFSEVLRTSLGPESDASEREGLVAELVGAIRDRTRRPVFGQLLTDLRGIVERWGSDDVAPLVAAVRGFPDARALPPVLVAHLGSVSPGDPPPPGPFHPPEWIPETPTDVAADGIDRVSAVRSMLAHSGEQMCDNGAVTPGGAQ